MTETELAVIRAAVDLVHYWHHHGDATHATINGPNRTDLEDKLADAVHNYARDGVHHQA